jgi:hypothetical protein
MPLPAPRLTTWTILAAAAFGVCVNNGCEKLDSEANQSERHVDDVARQALENEEAQQPQLYGQAAVDVTGKSDVAVAHARQLQAQAEYNAGTQMMRQATNQASALAMQMIDINHLLSTIQTSNALVVGYGKYDSTPIKQQAAEEISAIRGSATQDAWVAGDHPVPSLSSVKQTISKLQGEIRQKQDQIDSLTKQRVADLRKAEDLSEKADQATGEAWVSVYKQASGLRKKAADISTHIDNITAEIAPLKVDLVIAQSNQQIAEAAITGIHTQAVGAEQNFTDLSQSVHVQDAVERQVYDNASAVQKDGAASLKAQLEVLVDQAAKVQTTWDAAAKLLSDSAEHFAAAQSAAESLQVKLDQRAVEIQGDVPEKAAWDQLKHVYSATGFQYARGVSLQTLGMLCADEISSLKQLSTLKSRATEILNAAKLTLPPSLSSADYDSAITQATTTGKESFTHADDLFQNVSNAPLASAEQKNGGRVARVLGLYGWYQFTILTGDTGAPEHLSAARDAIKDAMDNNAALPMLPLEIEPRIALPATSAPAAQSTASAAVTGAPADDATVATIKQSAKDAITALQSGDPAKMKQFIVAPPELAGSMDSMMALVTSGIHLQKAMEAKFGTQANAGQGAMQMNLPTPEKMDAMMSQAQFTMTSPTTVSMTIPGSPQPTPLVKNGDEWAIDLAAAMKAQPQMQAMLPAMSQAFTPMADGMNQVAADVDAGKYSNPKQVQAALQKMMMPIVMKAMQAAAAAPPPQVAGAATTAPTGP